MFLRFKVHYRVLRMIGVIHDPNSIHLIINRKLKKPKINKFIQTCILSTEKITENGIICFQVLCHIFQFSFFFLFVDHGNLL